MSSNGTQSRQGSSRRGSIHQVISLTGSRNVCSTAIWERRSAIDKALFDDYQFYFEKYDTNGDGCLAIDEVFDIFEEIFDFHDGGRPKVLQVLNLVSAFSADDSGELNLSEFATMMHYIAQCNKMTQFLSEDNDDDDDSKPSCSSQITAAIEMYEKSITITQARLVEKLGPINSIITMKDVPFEENTDEPNPMDTEFSSVYGPTQMRCLALVSHNGMKETMKRFVIANKNILKKFRLTGTNSTMSMLKSVFDGDNSVVFGPSCMSGPLGGDAQLVAMICNQQLGGVIFFEDPLDSHPHNGDIECLNRNIKIYNIMHACNTVSAHMMVNIMRIGLEHGKPELLPSFFKTLQCPTVMKYKLGQQKVIKKSVEA